jgi:hypothetical protein
MMKIDKKDVLAWCIAIVIVLGLCFFFYVIFIRPIEYHKHLCADALGIEYSSWSGYKDHPYIRYYGFSEKKFNCCWVHEDPELTDNGWEYKEVCKGFILD